MTLRLENGRDYSFSVYLRKFNDYSQKIVYTIAKLFLR